MKIKEYVSKRIGGAVCLSVGLGMAIASGVDNYNPSDLTIASVLGIGMSLLGIDAYKQLKSGL